MARSIWPPYRGAPAGPGALALCLSLWFLWATALGEPEDPEQCRDRSGSIFPVAYVVDGDTVALRDGRRLRLIGVDTPEIGRKGKPHQPGAVAASKYLEQLLQESEWNLRLRYDKQRQDRYHRLLAHAFLPDGQSISAALLREGLGTPLLIPPNVDFLSCYQQAALAAIDQQAGLWSRADYRPMPVHSLSRKARGYRQLFGVVERVKTSSKALSLYLEGGVHLRISSKYLPYFDALDSESLPGSPLAARGMLYASSQGWLMHVRHPTDLACPGTPWQPFFATPGHRCPASAK